MNQIVSHYGEAELYRRIVAAIGEAGIDNLTVDDLGPVDEFHIGGRAATENLLAQADIPHGSRLLDIGSGVGGTARHLADTGSHTVTGVDLTPEYVEVAIALNRLVGLDGSVTFQRADVLDLPFPAESFDAALQLHVGMNIADKQAAFSEVSRILVRGGVFAIYDIMGARAAALDFPVPWAAAATANFLATSDEYVELLEATGFEIQHIADRAEFAGECFKNLRARSGPPPPLGLHLLMGQEASTRYGNMVAAVGTGAISPIEIVARRSARVDSL